MKTPLGAALALACLAVAGCTGPAPGTGPISSGTGTLATAVTYTQQQCGSSPTVAVVEAVLGELINRASGNALSGDALAKAAAGALCAAVAPLASGPGLEGVRQGYVGRVHVGIVGDQIVKLP